jgi:hypothetical protein
MGNPGEQIMTNALRYGTVALVLGMAAAIVAAIVA